MAWLVFGLGALYFAYAWVQRVAPAVMVDGLMRDFAVGGAILGNLSAVYFYAYAGMQLPVGMLIDCWGPRRVLGLMAAVAGLGGLLFATAEGIGAAYAGRFLVGFGAAFGFVGALTLATNWFPPRRFAMLAGAAMMAGMLGGMIGQAPLATLVESVGWRDALVGTGLFGFVLSALIWLIVRDRPPKFAGERGEAVTEEAAARSEPEIRHSVFTGLGQVTTLRANWLLALFGGLVSAPLLAFGGLWGVPYLMQVYGASRPGAALAVSLMLVGWAVGSPLIGWLSDRLGRRRAPMIVGAALALMAMLAVLYLPGLPMLVLGALLFLSGAGSASMVICYALARETNPPQAVGTAYGFVNMVVVGSGAVFQPIIGWLLDRNWDGTMEAGARVYSQSAYDAAFVVLPGCLAVGLIAGLLVREPRSD